ncbi:MAG: GNAT family N-acetyltransferase [Candidatus Hodarchaeota archaeon]
MIRLSLETSDDISDLLAEYGKLIAKQRGIPSFPIKERFKTSLERNTKLLAFSNKKDVPVGIVMTSNEEENSNEVFISAFYSTEKVKDRENLEKRLFNSIFNELNSQYTIIRVAEIPLSSELKDHILASSFKQFDRWQMSIDRSTIQALPKLNFPSGYTFAKWNDDFREPLIELITNCNEQSVDNELFPYFKNVNTVRAFIEDLRKNRWGRFEEKLTSILIHNDELIGVCFFTVLDNGNGYIPDIGILKTYQGKGLGKKLLIHSLKHYIELQDSKEIVLDVTLKNAVALHLYKSLGFKFNREYSVFVWNEKDPT